MKKILILMVVLLVALSACKNISENNQNGSKACTKDAKACPDGSSVGRNPEDNCNFYACQVSGEKPIPVESDGGIGTTDLYTNYVSTDKEVCKTTRFQCTIGASPFNDDTGCGCKADESKKYTSTDLDQCSRIRYICIKNYKPFTDEKGCGCEFTFGEETSGQVEPEDGKKLTVICTEEQRKATACTMEYSPVCGWFGENIKCIRYPCAQTYSNTCGACQNENVGYWTEGECPRE
jgi:hypothetical protein